MKKQNAFGSARLAAGTAIGLVISSPAMAQLQQARTTSQSILSEIQLIVPIIATIILIFAGIGYAWRMVEKDTFFRIGTGCIVAGSAGAIVPWLFGSGG